MRRCGHVSVLLVVILALAGCGGDEGSSPAKPSTVPEENGAAEAPGPPSWAVAMSFDVDLPGAKKQGRVASDAEAASVIEDVMSVVKARLRAAEVGQHAVVARGVQGFEVGFATLAKARHSEIAKLIARIGTLEFLIVVRAPKQFSKAPGNEDPVSPRHPLWPGDQASYRAFVDQEIRAWTAARKAGKAYQPARPRFRIVPGSKAPDDEQLFVLVETPQPDEAFDGRMVENARLSRGVINQPVVMFDIKEAWQSSFGAWTEKNVHLPLAIVLDGVVHSSPVIQAKLTESVQVTMERGSAKEKARDAKALAIVLQTGALLLSPTLVSIKTD